MFFEAFKAMSKKKDEKKGMNTPNGSMPNMQGPGANFANDPRSPYYNVYGPGAQNNHSNSYYNNYGGSNPIGGQTGNANNAANSSMMKEDNGKLDKKNKYVMPDGSKMTKKQRKIAKKKAKFDDNDLRAYPMTVGKWIGTFIIMAIPLINIIAGICWLFGVGNKSRSAYVRAHLVIFLIVVLLIGLLLGVGWKVMKDKASKEVGAETFGEVAYYIVDQALMLVEPVMGKDAADAMRAQVAAMLGVKGPDIEQDNGGNGGYDDDYNNDDYWNDWDNDEEDYGSNGSIENLE